MTGCPRTGGVPHLVFILSKVGGEAMAHGSRHGGRTTALAHSSTLRRIVAIRSPARNCAIPWLQSKLRAIGAILAHFQQSWSTHLLVRRYLSATDNCATGHEPD